MDLNRSVRSPTPDELREIADYASAYAGTVVDLDPELEAAGIAALTHRATKSNGMNEQPWLWAGRGTP